MYENISLSGEDWQRGVSVCSLYTNSCSDSQLRNCCFLCYHPIESINTSSTEPPSQAIKECALLCLGGRQEVGHWLFFMETPVNWDMVVKEHEDGTCLLLSFWKEL